MDVEQRSIGSAMLNAAWRSQSAAQAATGDSEDAGLSWSARVAASLNATDPSSAGGASGVLAPGASLKAAASPPLPASASSAGSSHAGSSPPSGTYKPPLSVGGASQGSAPGGFSKDSELDAHIAAALARVGLVADDGSPFRLGRAAPPVPATASVLASTPTSAIPAVRQGDVTAVRVAARIPAPSFAATASADGDAAAWGRSRTGAGYAAPTELGAKDEPGDSEAEGHDAALTINELRSQAGEPSTPPPQARGDVSVPPVELHLDGEHVADDTEHADHESTLNLAGDANRPAGAAPDAGALGNSSAKRGRRPTAADLQKWRAQREAAEVDRLMAELTAARKAGGGAGRAAIYRERARDKRALSSSRFGAAAQSSPAAVAIDAVADAEHHMLRVELAAAREAQARLEERLAAVCARNTELEQELIWARVGAASSRAARSTSMVDKFVREEQKPRAASSKERHAGSGDDGDGDADSIADVWAESKDPDLSWLLGLPPGSEDSEDDGEISEEECATAQRRTSTVSSETPYDISRTVGVIRAAQDALDETRSSVATGKVAAPTPTRGALERVAAVQADLIQRLQEERVAVLKRLEETAEAEGHPEGHPASAEGPLPAEQADEAAKTRAGAASAQGGGESSAATAGSA